MTVLAQTKSAVTRTRDWDVMWERYGITAVLLVVRALAALLVPNFATQDNFFNILRQGSFVGVAAVGMTIAIISGTFDLSVGTALALCAWLTIWVAGQFGLVAGLGAGLVTGVVIGIVNGLLVTRVRIPAFVATLIDANPLSLATEALRNYAFKGLPIEPTFLFNILLASVPFAIVGALAYMGALRKLQVQGKL